MYFLGAGGVGLTHAEYRRRARCMWVKKKRLKNIGKNIIFQCWYNITRKIGKIN